MSQFLFPWLGVVPPVPTCESCGAVAAATGPVIPMVPVKERLPSFVVESNDLERAVSNWQKRALHTAASQVTEADASVLDGSARPELRTALRGLSFVSP